MGSLSEGRHKKARVKIINLTQDEDIEEMLSHSVHDKRAAFDLDEVIIGDDKAISDNPSENMLKTRFEERIESGMPALCQLLSMKGYDVWAYTSHYISTEFMRWLLKKHSVRVDGIVTGNRKKRPGRIDARKKTRQLLEAHYRETLHIDKVSVLRSFTGSKEFEEYSVKDPNSDWALQVMDIIRQLEK